MISHLNKNQREAATTIDQHVRIIAGAGSGKTRVLMARIAYLIEEVGIYPNRIMAITFTNKATNEMKDRLHSMLGAYSASVRVSTIHSLCTRLLREDAETIGYPKSFTILDSDDQKQILRPFYKQMDIEVKSLPYSKVLAYIGSYKEERIPPEVAKTMAVNDEYEKMAILYEKYEWKRKEMRAFDFNDLLIEAHRMLKNNRSVREKWHRRLDYIHVDEFQDVDPIQYDIIRMLTGNDTILCVVGDPDQTIYTWRGASVDIILRFDKDFPNTKTIILNQNYRSTQPILNASNEVIHYNKNRIEKDLFSEIEGNELIHVKGCEGEVDEPVYVAREIYERHKEGIEYKDIAVLYRSNYISRKFEQTLRKVGIPYIIYGGIRFYERQEIKDALSYLKLCTLPDEADPEQFALDLAVLRVINQPRRGIGQKTMDTLQEEASRRHMNLYEVLKNPESVNGATAKKLSKFVELIEDLKYHRKDYSLEDFLEYVLDTTGYKKMLEEEHEDERIQNLFELKGDIAQSIVENPEMTLEEYLQEVSLFTEKSKEEKANSVSLMTVHAAKGLEYDTVFIVSFNDGIFPSQRAIEEGGQKALEEERRLCYVAMTRAKNKLYITWAAGYSYVLNNFMTPSRFRKEIPESCIYQKPKPQPKEKEVVILSTKKDKGGKYKKGDVVEHTNFGEGVVISLKGNVVSVAFGHGIGVKNLNALHPSLKKK
ncbi:MAG: UvrD-helicase domain-containing protein [Holdemanella sp.]|nr:UvrD-helicase domain-containing protein [Holdemanella sp.]